VKRPGTDHPETPHSAQQARRGDRLFFALYPDEETARNRIAPLANRLRSELHLQGRVLAVERLHMTLHFLGDFAGLPEELLNAAQAAAASVRLACFELCFDVAASFDHHRGHRNPFVLQGAAGSEGATALRHALGQALAAAGIPSDPRFTPHVTLLYDDRVVPPQTLSPPVRWTAREVVLVHSLVGRGTHVPIARWPLH
jgi:2'-5' RNA ligase